LKSPLVSALITVYNRDRYLAAAVDGVLAQTMQDFEVIIVDDGSTDGSVEIAQNYAAREARIRFFRNERNLGDYPNRNRAASVASGRYLKYVDADDIVYPHCLQTMVEGMEKCPEAALGLAWSVLDPPQPYPFMSSPAEVYRAHYLGRSLLGVGPSAAIIRRDAFEAVGGFTGRQFVGDSELWLKLAARWPLVSLPPSLVWWRRHEGQQMTLEKSKPEVLDARFKLERSVLAMDNLLSDADKILAQRRLCQHHARRLLSLGIRSRQPAQAWWLFRESGIGLRGLLRGFRRYQ